MGHHARTLTAVIALCLGFAAVAGSAMAAPLSITARVETPTAPTGLVPRTTITLDDSQPLTIHSPTAPNDPAKDITCSGASAIAALDKVTNHNWTATDTSVDASTLAVKSIKSASLPGAAGSTVKWVAYVDQAYQPDLCTTPVPVANTEVLFYPWCNSTTNKGNTTCFGGGPLWLRLEGGDRFPQSFNVGLNIFTNFEADASLAPDGTGGGGPRGGAKGPTAATLTADNGDTTRTDNINNYGIGSLRFPEQGPGHSVLLTGADPTTNQSRVPDRVGICVTDGGDGFCGTTRSQGSTFDVNSYPSPCTTNGHDGFCGTTDTSGPVTHVTNIADKKVFKAKKGPGQVKGTIDLDPNGVGAVKLRLTRVVTARVKVKAKKKKGSKKKPKARYKTVKRCYAWNDATLLLAAAKRCGTKYGTWWTADLSDLRDAFTYNFAMTLPRGTYTLEVSATDEDGHVDVPTKGRNVLTFVVK